MTQVLDLNQVVAVAREARQNAVDTFELIEAARGAKHELQNLIEGFAERLGIAETLKRLKELPRLIEEATSSLAEAESRLLASKVYLRDVKETVELTITEATTEAYATETVNGQNAEIRKVQLNAWLGKSSEVQKEKGYLRQAESQAVELEAKVIQAKATYKARTGALRAACHAAELQAALLFTTRDEEV